jgi:glycosyltransferase involved in cell wall biosynthesis
MILMNESMLEKRKNILLIIPNLSAGGAEKVMCFLAKNLGNESVNVRLIVIGSKQDTVYDTTDIDILYLNKRRVKFSVFSLIRLIKKYRPNLVLSSLSHLNALMGIISYVFPKIVFVGRETIVSSAQDNLGEKKRGNYLLNKIYKISYKGLDALISQSKDMKNDLISYQGYKPEKINTINNPISDNFSIKEFVPDFTKEYHFITVGRLTKKKGHERIIKCLAQINVPFIYTIIGDGSEKESIFNLANKYNLANKIQHIPFTNEVNKYLKNNHIYLQGSYVEGFPNALLESLAVGTPALVFKAPGGINEIIVDYENGFAAKDEDEFVKELQKMILSLEQYPPDKVQKHVRQNFGSTHILNEYRTLFKRLIAEKESA